MLPITIKPFSVFDEKTDSFITVEKHTKLLLENSLFAVAEWEKKYKKPWFPDKKVNPYAKKKQEEKTPDEVLFFIKCMIHYVDGVEVIHHSQIDESLLYGLTEENYKAITDYLQDDQTALKSIPEVKPDKKHKSDPIKMTSERIYAWLAEQQIPFKPVEWWNITRLFNIVQIVNYDNTPDDRKKRQKPFEVAQDYARINEQRLKQLGTKG